MEVLSKNNSAGTAPPAFPFRVAILTCSDRCFRGETVDRSGPALASFVQERWSAQIIAQACLPDEPELIARQILAWAEQSPAPEIILTTGGTGLGPRDLTPEATRRVLDRPWPALLELARLRCLPQTPLAYLSRGEAGVVRRSLVINLPGSPRGAVETLAAISDVLPHALAMLRGEGHEEDRPSAG
jgi:molybdenum cofactor synthesis domain-containing protein